MPYVDEQQLAATAAPKPATRRVGLPSKSTLDYAKVAIELLLLALAIPWIVRELTRNPGRLSKRAAAKHLTG